MNPNLDLDRRLLQLLFHIWNGCEGMSEDDMRLLCFACGVDSGKVMIHQPTPDVRYDGNPDLNVPF